MAIEVQCPTCGAVLPAPDEYAGKKIRCADCEALVDVPTAVVPHDELQPVFEEEGRQNRKPKVEWDDDPTPSGRPATVLTGTAVGWLLLLGLLSCAGLVLLGMALIPA